MVQPRTSAKGTHHSFWALCSSSGNKLGLKQGQSRIQRKRGVLTVLLVSVSDAVRAEPGALRYGGEGGVQALQVVCPATFAAVAEQYLIALGKPRLAALGARHLHNQCAGESADMKSSKVFLAMDEVSVDTIFISYYVEHKGFARATATQFDSKELAIIFSARNLQSVKKQGPCLLSITAGVLQCHCNQCLLIS